MKLISLSLLLSIVLLQGACSVFNPNPGETEADTFIQQKKYEEALAIIEPLAKQGIPWAQLRLGIAYEYGQGKKADTSQALQWYRRAATKLVDLPWADGVQLLSAGEKGFFYQNHDARVAQYLMARLYADGAPDLKKNPELAWRWIQRATTGSEGKDLVFCCENSRLKKQLITAERLQSLKMSIEKQLTPQQLEVLESDKNWNPEQE